MKTWIDNLFLLLALLAGLALILPGRATAQTFTTSLTTLHSFYGSRDGAGPQAAALILSSNTLYGSTRNGGISNNGTIFATSIDGTGFRKLHDFTGGNDGGHPYSGLLLSGHTLYGTASSGGTWGNGTVFAVDTNGTGFRVLHAFTRISGVSGPHWLVYSNDDGAYPFSTLVISGGTLYGTATRGGLLGQGTLFAVNTNGTGFTNLHSFNAGSAPTGLLLSSNILYGSVRGGTGFNDYPDHGSVFAVGTNGAGFTTLHSFTGVDDGVWPNDELVLMNKTLYGSTLDGFSGRSTVFKVNIDGTGFAILHTFSTSASLTNSDGAAPWGGVIALSNLLYGTTSLGGIYGSGTIFTIKTDGTGFSPLYAFSTREEPALTNSDGGGPGGLILSGGTLYGAANRGGASGNGTVFSLALIPVTEPLIVSQPVSRTNVVGSTANFNVSAKAIVPLSYQWLKGAGLMLHQTGSTLTLTNVADTDAAVYSVVVSNAAGSVTSNPAMLTVIDRPHLTVNPSRAKVILTWPTDATGLTLQSTTNLGPTAVWTTNLPAPVVVNGQYSLTNPISGTRQFFRLSQ